MSTAVLGIDIGGSGIKGAPVDLVKGGLTVPRVRIATPQPATPDACAEVVAEVVKNFEAAVGPDTPIGCTFPGVVWGGVVHTAANMDPAWVDLDADALFEKATGRRFTVLNDAQAAVLAEVNHGAGKGVDGMVLMLTFGTGIGSGLAYRGVAVPGVELGHMVMHGVDAETIASANVKEQKKLGWKAWSELVNDYLFRVEKMLWPELIIIGGGISEKSDKFLPKLKSRVPIVPAQLVNGAGIVGAAIAATSQPNVRRS